MLQIPPLCGICCFICSMVSGSVVWRVVCAGLLLGCLACGTKRQPGTTDVAIAMPDTQKVADSCISDALALVHDGDIIMRADNDLVSASLRNLSRVDKTWSHCGFLFKEDSGVYVYHVMAGDENPSEQMLRQPLAQFVSPHHKTGFGIFRSDATPAETSAVKQYVHALYSKHLLFDKKFSLLTDDQMYCTEVIYKAYKICSAGRIVLPTTTRSNFRGNDPSQNLHIKKLEYVALDNVTINPHVKLIKKYQYPVLTLDVQE